MEVSKCNDPVVPVAVKSMPLPLGECKLKKVALKLRLTQIHLELGQCPWTRDIGPRAKIKHRCASNYNPSASSILYFLHACWNLNSFWTSQETLSLCLPSAQILAIARLETVAAPAMTQRLCLQRPNRQDAGAFHSIHIFKGHSNMFSAFLAVWQNLTNRCTNTQYNLYSKEVSA